MKKALEGIFEVFDYLYDISQRSSLSKDKKDNDIFKYAISSNKIAESLSTMDVKTVRNHLLDLYDLTHDINDNPKPFMGVCLECYKQDDFCGVKEIKRINPHSLQGNSNNNTRSKTLYFVLRSVLSINDYEILKASIYSNQYLDAASQKRIYNALSVMENPRVQLGDGSEFKDTIIDPDASINDKVSLLLDAIQREVKVQFTYCKYQYEDNSIKLKNNHEEQGEKEIRKFSPYVVFSHNGMFYLIAMEDEMDAPIAHHYRVDRIKNLKKVVGKDVKNDFEKRKPMTTELRRYLPLGSEIFDMHKYVKDHPMMFNAYAKDMLTVKLSVAKSLLNVMVDFFADDLNKDHVMEDPKDNSRVIITVYASDLGIKNICKQYGSDAVLLPATKDTAEKDKEGIDRLRKELKDELEKAKAFY